MHLSKGTFDGEKVIVPGEVRGFRPGEVVVVFENGVESGGEREGWARLEESAFAKAWDNDEDAVYDNL